MGAMQSVLPYGAEVWVDVLDKEVHRKCLAQVQRREALRVASAYRTVSELAMMVIAGVIPVALLAKERKAIYRRKGENLREVVACEERERTFLAKMSQGAEHIFFSCERWCGFRQQLYADTAELFPSNIVREMLKSAASWNRIVHYVRAFHIANKIELDRRRDRTVLP